MVNTNKLKLTLLQQEILDLLFKETGKTFNQRNLAKELKFSPPAIKNALPLLFEKKLISIQRDESKRLIIEINGNNPQVIKMKRVGNLKFIYESKLIDFLEENLPGGTAILFGSYSKGEDTINSDIDIAIIGRKEKNFNLEKFEKYLKRKIIIQFYNSFKNIHKNLKENIFNGIVLFGGIEL
jgi:predicted nucleotidyltransferase